MSKSIEGICFQCDEVRELLKGQTTCIHCDSLNRKNDYEQQLCDGLSTNITKDNIHLYYEFMNCDDIRKYSSILNKIFETRFDKIIKNFNVDIDTLETYTDKDTEIAIFDTNYRIEEYAKNSIGIFCFNIKDTLKPIDEYINEIKHFYTIETEKQNFKDISEDEILKVVHENAFEMQKEINPDHEILSID